MDTEHLIAALRHLCDAEEWRLNGPTYTDLEWFGSPDDLPSEEDLENTWVEISDDYIRAQVQAARRGAFAAIADPIYLQWQRGEATEQDWLDAVEMVRARYPYPEEAP